MYFSLSAGSENSGIANRSRPAWQYQIAAARPCVAGLVSESEYAQQVEYVRCFCPVRTTVPNTADCPDGSASRDPGI